MNKFKTLATGLTLAIASLGAFAQAGAPATPRVDQREANQQARIDAGVACGQLNARETQSPGEAAGADRRRRAHAKADGIVTPRSAATWIACRTARARTSTPRSTTRRSRRSP